MGVRTPKITVAATSHLVRILFLSTTGAQLGPDLIHTPRPLFPGLCLPGGDYWPDRHNSLFTLEATGYALLALVKLGHIAEAEAPFKWLNSQRRRGGGFGSTQVSVLDPDPGF